MLKPIIASLPKTPGCAIPTRTAGSAVTGSQPVQGDQWVRFGASKPRDFNIAKLTQSGLALLKSNPDLQPKLAGLVAIVEKAQARKDYAKDTLLLDMLDDYLDKKQVNTFRDLADKPGVLRTQKHPFYTEALTLFRSLRKPDETYRGISNEFNQKAFQLCRDAEGQPGKKADDYYADYQGMNNELRALSTYNEYGTQPTLLFDQYLYEPTTQWLKSQEFASPYEDKAFHWKALDALVKENRANRPDAPEWAFLQLLCEARDNKHADLLEAYHRDYVQSPPEDEYIGHNSYTPIAELFRDEIGDTGATPHLAQQIVNILADAKGDAMRSWALRSLTPMLRRGVPGIETMADAQRDKLEKAIKESEEARVWCRNYPMTAAYLKRTKRPLLMLMHGGDPAVEKIEADLKATPDLKTRWKLAVTLLKEASSRYQFEDAALLKTLDTDLTTFWQQYFQGKTRQMEKVSGTNITLFEVTDKMMTKQPAYLDFLAQVVAKEDAPAEDRLNAFEVISRWYRETDKAVRVDGAIDPTMEPAYETAKASLLKSADDGVFLGAMSTIYNVVHHRAFGKFLHNVNRLPAGKQEKDELYMPDFSRDLKPHRARLARLVGQVKPIADEIDNQPEKANGLGATLQALIRPRGKGRNVLHKLSKYDMEHLEKLLKAIPAK